MDSSSDERFGPHERGVWSQEEHDKFLAAVALHPHGPWKTIAALVGTRSVRQVQTHAQKYHEKVNRRARGLQKNRQKVARQEHRLDDAAQDFLARPRGGKGQKRGKYNKRNRDARVAPIPPRPARAIPVRAPTPETTIDTTTEPAVTTPPPVACEDSTTEAPLPSPSEVSSPDVFKSPSAPSGDLLLEAAELFPLTDDSRPSTPLVLASPAPSADLDGMLYDDIVAVEEAPEHALSFGEVPTLNDALDYFLKVMTAWGPTTGGAASGNSPRASGFR